jgi:hypothetical protein
MKVQVLSLTIAVLLGGCLISFPQQSPDVSSESINPSPVLPHSCETIRFLNPDPQPQPQEPELDQYFRLAFEREVAGNFREAISYYQKAADNSTCECERKHALAGKQAAQEAQDLVNRHGMTSKPTQYFWGRLQELTQSLPCVQTQ